MRCSRYFSRTPAHPGRSLVSRYRAQPGSSSSLHLPKSETRTASGYRYNLLSSDNLVVKQYVHSGTNAVFGVTWKGRRMPSLQTLLGFDPYKVSGPGVIYSLHAARIQTDSLSVVIVALKGHYAGRAVRTDLLPQGVPASVVMP